MTNKRVKLYTTLNELHKPDVYSLLLFTLFKLKDAPEYSTLSELSYTLDHNNLINFLSLFGGTTIKVPTIRELKLVLYALDAYKKVNFEDEGFTRVIKDLAGEFTAQEITEAYQKISEVVKDYEFKREP